MNERTDRQLDLWVIYRDPEHILDALKIILEHKDEITKDTPLTLFTNCASKFTIDGQEIGRTIDTLVCSRKADISLCLCSARYTDEDLGGISATPEDIVSFFDKHNIPYQLVTGEPPKNTDNRKIPEIWFAREASVLKDALKESKERGDAECTFYPNITFGLSMGYYSDAGTYHEIWGVGGKGLAVTNTNWTVLIQEGSDINLSSEEAIEIIKHSANKCIVNKQGRPWQLEGREF